MLKCIIVDDEEMAIKVIESHLTPLKNFEIVGKFANAIEAFSALQQQKIDVMFLDIQMPQMTGLTLLRTLPKQPLVVFTTAHREFALDGFDLNVVDYLLKPISFERFMQAVGKILTLAHLETAEPALPAPSPTEDAPFIYIKSDRQFIKILLDEIDYIESLKNHVKIVVGKETHMTLLTISEMEEKLPPQRFLRIHRSYIVSVGKITQFTHTNVMIGTQFLPIGNLYKNEVLKKLNQNLIGG